jgi:hypothetical protein
VPWNEVEPPQGATPHASTSPLSLWVFRFTSGNLREGDSPRNTMKWDDGLSKCPALLLIVVHADFFISIILRTD